MYTVQCTMYNLYVHIIRGRNLHITLYTVQCTVYSSPRPVRTKFFFAILKTFTSVTIMYAMMNKCLQFYYNYFIKFGHLDCYEKYFVLLILLFIYVSRIYP